MANFVLVLAGELLAGRRGLLGLVTGEALVLVLGLSKLLAGGQLGPLAVGWLMLAGLPLIS